MASIGKALARVKQDPLAALGRPLVERVCRELGHEWRDRELDPATTIALFAQQVLHGNCSCNETRRIARATFTGSAYCQARGRLPLAVYQELLRRVCEAVMPRTREAEHLWRGHRTFHVDGSSFSMPDTPELRKAFGLPSGQKEGCGFPTAHLLVLFSAATGLLLDAVASPLRTGDVSEAPGVHRHLSAGDLLVGDDSFGTYVHLALLLRAGLHGLFPVHHARIVDFTPHRPHTAEGDPVPGARSPQLALGQAPGQGRPTGRVVQAEGAAAVDGPRGVRLAAGVDPRAGGAADGAGAGRREGDADGGDHAGGREALPAVGADGPAAEAVGRGDEHRAPEDDDGDGRAAVPERGGGAEGAGGVLPGVQPGARGDAGGGAAAGGAGGPRQLRRRPGVGEARAAGGRAAGPGGEPAAAGARGAAGGEAAVQAVRPAQPAAR